MSNTGKKPDFNVSAMDTTTEPATKNNRIGAAWTNDDGSIRVKIDPFVVIHGGPNMYVTLWPNDGEQRGRGGGGSSRTPGRRDRGGENDDIPF